MAILVPAIVAVFIPASKSFAEVIAIVVETYIVRIVPKGRVLIAVGILIVESPAVLTVGLTCVKPFFVSAIDRVLKHLGTVAARIVVAAAPIVTVIVDQIVIVPSLLKP